MKMPRAVTEIDRLIEQGLGLYGEGDLDGALLLWERALAIDPENAQANSYVDYVKINYDLLTSDAHTDQSGPFGIGEGESDYQIEILPGEDIEPVVVAPPLYMDRRDEGWMINEEGDRDDDERPPPIMLELDADEPPPPLLEPSFETALTGESVSFEDNTREYPTGRPSGSLLADGHAPSVPSDFVPEVTPAFGSAADLQTPPGFSMEAMEVTEMRRRDLGFVQPAEPRPDPGPPELKMTLRTPSAMITLPPAAPPALVLPLPSEPEIHRAPTADGDNDEADTAPAKPGGLSLDLVSPAGPAEPAYVSLDLDLTPLPATAAQDRAGEAEPHPEVPESAANTVDLVMSLPTPRPPVSSTRPLPAKPRLPAPDSRPPSERAAGEPAGELPPSIGLGSAPTQETPLALQLDPLIAISEPPSVSGTVTHDFSEKPTHSRGFRADDVLITAPTRDLGLRASSDDETTHEVDVHKMRKARGTGKPQIPQIPAMDPIDARSAEILEEIDRDVPASESREDRTRRRITVLLERATEWSRGPDLARAVTAVDLALSEDPNSALAQKLIHRNREAIMTAFQGFLGNLERIPVLARPLHELGSAPISPRAAFLLSRVDGTLSLDEILDVSGMPRLEAYRYLCQLLMRGILR